MRQQQTIALGAAFLVFVLGVHGQPAAAQDPPRDDSHWISSGSGAIQVPVTSAMDENGRIVVAYNLHPDPSSSGGFILVERYDPTSGAWERLGDRLTFGATGVRGLVTYANGDVYVGGNFFEAINTDGSTVSVTHVVRWDEAAQSWDNLGGGMAGGMTAQVETVAGTPNGDFCVGGTLGEGTNRDGTTTELNNIGCWDGSRWNALGGGVGAGTFPTVLQIAVEPNGSIVASGNFTETFDAAGGAGTPRNHLARWTGSQWEDLGGGLNDYAVAGIVSNGMDVFVGGVNLVGVNPGGGTVPGDVLRWDGAAWTVFENGLPVDPFVTKLRRSGNGTLYAKHGAFEARVFIFRPGDTMWSVIGEVPAGSGVATMLAATPAVAEDAYLGGQFTEISEPPNPPILVSNHVRWDGAAWLLMPVGGTSSGSGANGPIYTVDFTGGQSSQGVVVGGAFTEIDFSAVDKVAFYDGTNWLRLGNGVTSPSDADVHAVASSNPTFSSLPTTLFVAGEFAEVQQDDGTPVAVSNIAAFHRPTETWFSIGQGVNGPVYALAYWDHVVNGDEVLYVGGEFTEATNPDGSTIAVNGVARYHFAENRWEALGGGVSGNGATVYALALGQRFPTAPPGPEPFEHDVFIGGDFAATLDGDGSSIGGTENIAWFSAKENVWRGVGQGAGSPVRALAYVRHVILPFDNPPFTYDRGVLYAGGDFQIVRNGGGSITPANYIAKWRIDTNEWAIIGEDFSSNGLDGPVHSLELHRLFTVARWMDRVGLVVGGVFTQGTGSDGAPVALNNLGLLFDNEPLYDLDGAFLRERFLPFGSGTNDLIHDTAVLHCPETENGETVYAGGIFSEAGGQPSQHLAKWSYVLPRNTTRSAVVVNGSSSCNNCRGASTGPIGPSPCPGTLARRGDASTVLFENIAFGEAVAILTEDLPYNKPIEVAVSSDGATIATLDSVIFETNAPTLLVITGVDDPGSYAPNPDGRSTTTVLRPVALPLVSETAPSDVLGISFLNAVTDAPSVDIGVQGGEMLAEDVPFGAANLIPFTLDTGSHTLEVRRSSDGQLLGTYAVDLTGEQTALILDGFLNPPANQNGPEMDLNVVDVTDLISVSTTPLPDIPVNIALEQNYPNPFNAYTTIRYDLFRAASVRLAVYDLLGREVAVLVDEKQLSGSHAVRFEASGLASGVYVARLSAGEVAQTQTMTVIR